MVTHVSNWIAGEERDAANSERIERLSPSTDVLIATAPRSGPMDVDVAVIAASAAQEGWSRTTVVERGVLLRELGRLLERDAVDLAELVRSETGKPIRDALGEVAAAAEMAFFMAGEGRRSYGRTTTSAGEGKHVQLVRAPVGVAALIVASNTPLPNYAWKVCPALLCGNPVVLKPSEDTPLSADAFARLMQEAGFPSGSFSLIHGLGDEAGGALVRHPGVRLVSFTGSRHVGIGVQLSAAARLARVCLELGGKNPLLVCDDADLEAAANDAAMSAFSNAGQRCAAGSRLLVFDEVYDQFLSMLVERTRSISLGPQADADIGPVVNKRHQALVLKAIDDAVARGARLLVGGPRSDGTPNAPGCFVMPTLLDQIEPRDPLLENEIFGPVATIQRVATFGEAVDEINASDYGLTAAIHTRSMDRAWEFVSRVEAGMVVVNGPTYGSEPHMPFGGVKQSGNGAREAGTEALDVYSEWKSVVFHHDCTRT